ncbi:MAG: TIGR04086 family membrane protein [Clostridia bacterium]|nr:TIGR04086 family membrane protein [Clostridia bacterium]
MKIVKGIGVGLAIGLIAVGVMLLLVSAILLSSDVTISKLNLWGKVILSAGALVAGTVASIIIGKTGWLMGLATGGLYWVLITALSWLFGTDSANLFSLSALGFSALLSLLGGMLGSLLAGRR